MHARLPILLFASISALLAQRPAAPTIPDTLIAERELVYSAVGGRQTMDVVRPRDAAASPRPGVLLVHGGGFRAGAKESYLPLAIKLAERGYIAATVNYRLPPPEQIPPAPRGGKAPPRVFP